jgi:hypothetical protein
MNDPIVEEVRRARDAHAARFNYDLDAIFQDIKEQEKKSGHKFVAGVARQAVPNQALQPQEDDSLMDELLATNPKFQELVAKSKRTPRKPFLPGEQELTNG